MQIAYLNLITQGLRWFLFPLSFSFQRHSLDLLFIKGLCILKFCQASKLNASEH